MGGIFSGGGGGSAKAPEPKPEPQPVAGVEKATQAQVSQLYEINKTRFGV